ncbi:hypothetical protein MTO96_039309 [Rhipicephalus appendiculatus]|uniref:Uncharacterized protein n=1 Tax=Rhipicephalus appendiculatus TaxID=34631 RepID=A0A131YSM6_RHIAP
MAIAVSAGLVLFTASVMRVGVAAQGAEDKVTCVQMMVGTGPRKCVHNLFNSLQVQLEEGVPIPLPKPTTDRVKVLAAGCLAVRALSKIPEYGCVPASSIVGTYECIYNYEEDKEEVLKAFAAKSKENYLEIANKVESCFGSWHATRNKAHPRFSRRRDQAVNHPERAFLA